jgi:hypothetical protein
MQQSIDGSIKTIVDSLNKLVAQIPELSNATLDAKKDVQTILSANEIPFEKKVEDFVFIKAKFSYEQIVNDYDKFYSSNKLYDFTKNGMALLSKPTEEDQQSLTIQKVLECAWNNTTPSDADRNTVCVL